MFELLAVIFDRSFVSAVVNSALATNIFYLGFLNKSSIRNSKYWVCFVAGQPLGYKGSWPLFSLSHHTLVWWVAERIYPDLYFDRYVLLGDDIVITDVAVAHSMLRLFQNYRWQYLRENP